MKPKLISGRTEREFTFWSVLRGCWKVLPKKIQKYLIIFAMFNVVTYFLLPEMYYGFWDTVSAIKNNMVERRIDMEVRRKYGNTIADIRLTGKEWGSLGAYFTDCYTDIKDAITK